MIKSHFSNTSSGGTVVKTSTSLASSHLEPTEPAFGQSSVNSLNFLHNEHLNNKNNNNNNDNNNTNNSAHYPTTTMVPLVVIPPIVLFSVGLLPIATSFISCLGLSYMLHFDYVTSTHCRVPNNMPSISASIGGYAPEKYIWQFSIVLMFTPRLIESFMHYLIYSIQAPLKTLYYKTINTASLLVVFSEYISLVLLSLITSRENHSWHKMGFISFMFCSVLHMILILILQKRLKESKSSVQTSKSYFFKSLSFMIHILSFMTAMYFYWRHNAYCEPYVYSKFAFCEYLTILSNIAFHSTSLFEFSGYSYAFGPVHEEKNG